MANTLKTKAQSLVISIKGSSIQLSIGFKDLEKLVSLVNSIVAPAEAIGSLGEPIADEQKSIKNQGDNKNE